MSLGENGDIRAERAEWMAQRLIGGVVDAAPSALLARVGRMEELVFGELQQLLGGDDNGGLVAAIEGMGEEFTDALESLDARLTDIEGLGGLGGSEGATTVTALGIQLERAQKQIAILAQFMERCLPYIRGMESAFTRGSTEDAEEV
jgi:hypothetical protein